ncbi:hypothetical protein BH708_09810 [Brachybacterium sp. P6-10-X1]|uniref:outer membrane protein assembly factor BamB family protein n=1 Tax=Brachybacterium sp. P6-10-X1 TaxID=1903186 RepID=UPI0009718329|nr:PQQ-binding-like beta-propeller repeat protein [Brachybacterium sp. P6-10-X1]APX32959.1 hypothetical protein BH708_09810 [Brachybacterium sp. P6-10-X1]
MSGTSPRAPGSDASPDAAGSGAPDTTIAIGLAVVLLALAGTAALLGGQFLLGALRLAAGILAGAGAGLLLLVLLGARVGRRRRRLVAGVLALAVALALTVPAVVTTRVPPLAEAAAASIPALGEGDTVHSVPAADSPVLVRRADGTGQLLGQGAAHEVDATTEDVLALSADGTRLIQVTGGETLVSDLTGSGVDEIAAVSGIPIALTDDLLVVRHCASDGAEECTLSGYDLTTPDSPRWTLSAPATQEARGIDPAGIEVPARPDAAPGPLDAVRATGVLPAVPLRFDPAQGWIQLDPATGFPVGRVLTDPEQPCRVTVNGPTPRTDAPVVVTVCSAADGALTATAHVRGEVLWTSEPSPAGQWNVQMDHGRVLATGTEEGTGISGEIVASEHRAAWTEPGAGALDEAVEATVRLGIDGARMVRANTSGQLVAYDTADGTNVWTLPLPAPDSPVHGTLEADTAVVLDHVERTRSLQPRGAQHLRVVDADGGTVTAEAVVTADVRSVHGVGDGRALVTVGDRTLLLGR